MLDCKYFYRQGSTAYYMVLQKDPSVLFRFNQESGLRARNESINFKNFSSVSWHLTVTYPAVILRRQDDL